MKELETSASIAVERRALLLMLAIAGVCLPMNAQGANKHHRKHSTLDSPANDSGSTSSDATIPEGVVGVVVDATGAPISGALIQPSASDHSGPIPDMAVMSGPDGRFLWRLKPGRYRLDAVVEGRTAASASVTVKSGAVTSVELRADK